MDDTLYEMELKLKGYRLTTAEILYYMPDHPDLLQSFLWQTYDLAPKFPRVHKFLIFWKDEIEAAIHSVRLASSALIKPSEFRPVDGEFRLH